MRLAVAIVVVLAGAGLAYYLFDIGEITAKESAPVPTERGGPPGPTAASLPVPHDSVQPTSAPTDWGILVDGASITGPLPFKDFRSPGPVLELDNVWGGDGNQLFAFAKSRSPLRLLGPWHKNPDTVPVTFDCEVGIDLEVHILDGDPTTQEQRLLMMVAVAGTIWSKEYVGVHTRSVIVRNHTEKCPGDILFQGLDEQIAQIRACHEPATKPSIHVYVVSGIANLVQQPFNGYTVTTDFVAITTLAPPTTLTHELGHAMGLSQHAEDVPELDRSNVMAQDSLVRWTLTEGQAFLMHYLPGSALATLFKPPGRTPVACALADRCPPLHVWIWENKPMPVESLMRDLSDPEHWFSNDCMVGRREKRLDIKNIAAFQNAMRDIAANLAAAVPDLLRVSNGARRYLAEQVLKEKNRGNNFGLTEGQLRIALAYLGSREFLDGEDQIQNWRKRAAAALELR